MKEEMDHHKQAMAPLPIDASAKGQSRADGPFLTSIHRYPIKGVGGERLTATYLTPSGIEYDRALALPTGSVPLEPYGSWTTYDAFHTLINTAELARSTARIVTDAHTPHTEENGSVEVTHPEQGTSHIPIRDGIPQPGEALGHWTPLTHANPAPVHLGVHLWDVPDAPISIINLASVRAFSERVGVALEPARFRGNLYIDGAPAWEEFNWLGSHLNVGDAELALFAPIERCRATSARPGSSEWDINVPGALAAHFGHVFFGLYARVTRPGSIAVTDAIRLISDRSSVTVDEGLCLDPAAPRWGNILTATEVVEGVHSLRLNDPTGMLDNSQAGQYVRVHGDDTQPSWRNYTISGQALGATRITVRNEPEGRFSPWITTRQEGHRLLLSGPYGTSVLSDSTAPVVLATAGIGITPTLSLLQALVDQNHTPHVSVIHAVRDTNHIPHWDEVIAAAANLISCSIDLFVTSPSAASPATPVDRLNGNAAPNPAAPHPHELVRWTTGRPTIETIAPLLTHAGAHVFICGPNPFIDLIRDAAATVGIPAEQVHVDSFYSPPDPDQKRIPAPSPGPWVITWADGAATNWVDTDGTLLDHAERNGIEAPAACRSGVCGTCSAPVHGSTATVLSPFAHPKAAEQLLCCVVPTENLRVDLHPANSPHPQ